MTVDTLVAKKKEPSAFGRILRETRVRQGLTLKQVAEFAGMKMLALQRLETAAHVNPQYLTILKLAAALGVPPHELIRQASGN